MKKNSRKQTPEGEATSNWAESCHCFELRQSEFDANSGGQ